MDRPPPSSSEALDAVVGAGLTGLVAASGDDAALLAAAATDTGPDPARGHSCLGCRR